MLCLKLVKAINCRSGRVVVWGGATKKMLALSRVLPRLTSTQQIRFYIFVLTFEQQICSIRHPSFPSGFAAWDHQTHPTAQMMWWHLG